MRLRRLATTALAAVAFGSLPLVSPAIAAGDYLQVIDATFPTDPNVTFSDTYDACRSGCERVHKATDLMGERMLPLFAMVEGEVCSIDDDEEDSYGRHLTICGDDGREYRYLHLNNDTPGTDDGAAGLEHVYARGIRAGARVARGQHIAFMGDSGNAEDSAPHLHLDIFDDRVLDPYGDTRINPYPTLIAALERGDVPDGTAVYAEPADRIAGEDRVETAIALARSRFDRADVALLAPWDSPGEAIVAGPLAHALEAPVFTTRRDALDPRVAAELEDLGVEHVYLVGDLLDGVDLTLDATRLGGADLFETAAAVADEVWHVNGAGDPLEHSVEGEHVHGDHQIPHTPRLEVAPAPDHADRFALDGARVRDDVYIRLTGPDPAVTAAVAFHLDDPGLTREPVQVERRAPWDLGGSNRGGARPLDTTALDNGAHRLTALVTGTDGAVTEVHADFEVHNVMGRHALVALGAHTDPTRAWPDSLMASYYGSALERPVLLVGEDGLPQATAVALEGVGDVKVVGGPAAVPDATLDAIGDTAASVSRIFGADRYATAAAITGDLLLRDLVAPDRVWAATGRNWPDAATAGPIVFGHAEALVLVDGEAGGADRASTAFLRGQARRVAAGIAIGGPVAISDDALMAFRLNLT